MDEEVSRLPQKQLKEYSDDLMAFYAQRFQLSPDERKSLNWSRALKAKIDGDIYIKELLAKLADAEAQYKAETVRLKKKVNALLSRVTK
jgi:hypothetical protein